jgi:hypothetical protein
MKEVGGRERRGGAKACCTGLIVPLLLSFPTAGHTAFKLTKGKAEGGTRGIFA